MSRHFINKNKLHTEFLFVDMVHLSEHNSKKYQAILRFKHQLNEHEESNCIAALLSSNERCIRDIDEFGEIATKQITHIQKRFTSEEIVILAEKYIDGESIRELAKEFGCDRNTVRNALKRNGVKIRGRGRQKRK